MRSCRALLPMLQPLRPRRLQPPVATRVPGSWACSSGARGWFASCAGATVRPAGSSNNSWWQGQNPQEVMLPLCERKQTAEEVTAAALDTWKQQALAKIYAIGNRFQDMDDGPSAAELKQELDWLLDDATKAQADGTVALRATLGELTDMFIHRRLGNREPFQYVTATAHWLDLVLCVGPGVLCPRPETETLLEIAEKAILDKPHLREGPWADLGTGSGALAIALARTLSRHETSQDTVVYAVECSPQAAAYAHVNIERCAPRQVELVSGNWCSPFLGSDDTAAPQERLVGKLAGLVSNPPYIPKADLAELQREVGEHEPRLALDGGEGDGLDHLRSIFHGAREVLMPGGFIAVETNGQEQCEELLASLQASRDWQEAAIHADLGGVTRFVSAVRSS
mmetsp:Transcript_4685/g.16784  ORF Transcript_4685/g.16784 Transcript_4685/m.16784 type:complete len:397 (+) Transcript_4685:80-1270(+)